MTSDLDPILADLKTAIRGATVKIESRRVELCNLGDIESAKTECKVSNLFTACQPSYCGLTALLFSCSCQCFYNRICHLKATAGCGTVRNGIALSQCTSTFCAAVAVL